ncbi:MAG: hypothetical protein ACHQRK_07530 [Gemmatimonadales bacterium]
MRLYSASGAEPDRGDFFAGDFFAAERFAVERFAGDFFAVFFDTGRFAVLVRVLVAMGRRNCEERAGGVAFG